jgi:hypothetical protein
MSSYEMRLADFNAAYSSTADFEAKVNASDRALDHLLKAPHYRTREALFAKSLLHHSKSMALSFAWDYQYKYPRTWIERDMEFEITNDVFTLSFDALREGKVLFVPCDDVQINAETAHVVLE